MRRALSDVRPAIAALVLLALAACNRGADQTKAPENSAAIATADAELIARITALPPGQLDIVLFRAIRDAQQDCQGIAASRRIDDQKGRPAWSAQCDRGGKFLLVLNPDGQMTVTAGAAFGQP